MRTVIWGGPVVTSDGDESGYEVESTGVRDGRHQDVIVYKRLKGARVAVEDHVAYTVLAVALCDLVRPEPEGGTLRQLDLDFTIQVSGTGSVRLSSGQTAEEAIKEVESSIREAQRQVAHRVGSTSPVRLHISNSVRDVKVGGQLRVAADLEKNLAGKQ